AEDGIRALTVTGVQTCALPISPPSPRARSDHTMTGLALTAVTVTTVMGRLVVVRGMRPGRARPATNLAGLRRYRDPATTSPGTRSEERRVGKAGRGARARRRSG